MKNNQKRLNSLLRFLLPLFIFSLPLVHAADLNSTITEGEKAQFDQILVPVMKIYNFVKYTASVIAVLAMLFAGISYMFSGNDIKKRDTAKNMATYVVIGLVIIWAAPFVVTLLIS